MTWKHVGFSRKTMVKNHPVFVFLPVLVLACPSQAWGELLPAACCFPNREIAVWEVRMAGAPVAVELKRWEVPWPAGGSTVVAPALTDDLALYKYAKKVKYAVPATKKPFFMSP